MPRSSPPVAAPSEAEQLGAARNPWVRAFLMGQGFQGSTVGEKICGSSATDAPQSAFRLQGMGLPAGVWDLSGQSLPLPLTPSAAGALGRDARKPKGEK